MQWVILFFPIKKPRGTRIDYRVHRGWIGYRQITICDGHVDYGGADDGSDDCNIQPAEDNMQPAAGTNKPLVAGTDIPAADMRTQPVVAGSGE